MEVLKDTKINHCRAVAEFLFNHTTLTDRRDEMYVLGLLHDIGYLYGPEGHSKSGGELLKRLGYADWSPVYKHGNPNEYSSIMTDELNWADMQIDHTGQLVGFTKRLESIKERYGEASKQYYNSKRIVDDLLSKGYIDIGSEA